ncbi:MAG: transcriptional regulator, partial [Alphaproteobacteria bacterium]
LVRLTHSGLPDREACTSHEKGWTHYLGRLVVAAAGGDPGPDRGLG